jgi:XTP/dITP diphosphohydrolase
MDVFRTTPRWIIASHNPGKIREIGELLTPRGIAAAGAGELGVPEPEETEDSFSGNALLKARACAAATGEVSLADDSGLAVTALNGAPGIHSARWAGEPRDFGRAMQRVHGELEAAAAQDRSARFVCALALAHPDGPEAVFEGAVDGVIVWPPRGDRGFGYDPVFQPLGRSETFAEIAPEEKHAMSHRADAFGKLIRGVFGS